MSQLRTPVLVAVLLSCAMACGDDDDDLGVPNTPPRDGGASDGGGDIGPSGPGDEGAPCDANNKCLTGFKCVMNVFTIGVCARGCSDATTCKTDEACFSYTDQDADKHCVNIVTDEYDLCGVATTSVCDMRSCLYFPNLPIGVCVDLCAVGGQSTADDAGVSDGLAICRSGETCIEGVVESPRKGEGVCGIQVERGDECGIERGLYCATGDRCLFDDPNDDNSKARCYQDCSTGNKCDTGKCTLLAGMVARCM